MQKHELSVEAVYGLYPGLQRVKGIDTVEMQIKRFEEEWRQLLKDAEAFAANLHEMKQEKILLIGTRYRKNYGMGKNLPDYPKQEYYMPYACFLYRGYNLNEWHKVYALLEQMNASADEIMIHLQVFWAMKDYYHRAGLLVFRLRQLYDLKVEIEAAFAVSGLDARMLPDRMRYNLDEEDLPGY